MAAKNYNEILALVNAGNQMGLSNTIKRDYGIPLDFTSVQPSYDDAVIYAAENTKAYVGQPISVGGKLYIINDVAGENKHVVGEKEYDNYLVEVGSATEGDGITIDLEEGVLTLHGFESALTGYLPRKAEDGSLEWVPISAVVQGDGNKVTTLTSEDGSVVITKKTDTDESLVYDLSVIHPDAPEYAVKADERAEGATETVYHLTKDGENVDVAIVVPDAYNDGALAARVEAIENDYLKEEDKYDDSALAARVKALEDEERYDETPLANRVGTLEEVVGDADGGLVKGLAEEIARATEAERLLGERIDGIDFVDETELANALAPITTALGEKAAQTDLEALQDRVDAFLTGTGATDALDSLQELIAYIESHDDVDIAGILEDIQGLENKFEGIDGTVKTYVDGAIDALKIGDYAKAADLADLASRVEALEAKPFDSYATKAEVENVDKKFENYTDTETLNGLLNNKADADKFVDNDTFAQFKTANEAAITGAREGAVADVEAKGYAVAAEVEETYATKQGLTDLGNTINASLNDYAKAADVNAELAKKIEGGAIAHTTEDLAEGVTVNGTNLNIVVDAFTKAETRQYVADTISQMTGGESAADVLLALNNHIAAYEEKVGQIDTKNNEQDTAITAAQTDATKALGDAAAAATAISELAGGQVATNANDILAIGGRLNTVEGLVGGHTTKIAEVEGKVTGLLAEDVKINEAIGTIEGNLTTETGARVAEDARIAALVAGNTGDITTLKGQVNIGETTITDYVAGEIAKIPTYDDAAIKALISAEEARADAEEKRIVGLVEAEAARADAAEKANKALIDGIDATLKAALENDGEGLDSIKELAVWIQEHETEVLPAIEANTNAIAALVNKVNTGDKNVAEYVADAIAGIPMATASVAGLVKASQEVTVAEDGTLGLGVVSTDKLVQGLLTLILDGGDAEVPAN